MGNESEASNPSWVSFTEAWHNKPYDFISPERPELSAAGKNVVIAGGGTGIGKATAIAFAQAGAASITILGRRLNRLEEAAAEIRAIGSKTTVLIKSVDMSQRAAADSAMESTTKKAGKIDIFIWCAGILPKTAVIKGYDEKEFRRGFDGIVLGAFNAIQAVLPVAAPGAKIINVSSGIAHIKPFPWTVVYAMYKAAVVKMFDFVAAENREVEVFHTQPGVIKTELNEDMDIQGQDEIELPAWFHVWLTSSEASFLKERFVWVNWDAQELIARSKEIDKNPMILRVTLDGVPM